MTTRARSPRGAETLEIRDAYIAAAYRGGRTLRGIARRFGLSHERVRVILAEQRVPMRPRGRRPSTGGAAEARA